MWPAASSNAPLKIGNVMHAVCLLGDAALVEQRLETLLSQWLTPTGRMVDAHTFHCGEVALTEALDCARLLPMGGRCRVVILRGVEHLSDEEAQRLEAYLQAPAATGRLVMLGTDQTSAALRKRLAAHCTVEQLELEARPARTRWIRDRLAAHGQSLAPDAMTVLEQLLEQETPGDVAQLLDQLSLYAGDRAVIDRALVERLTHPVTPSTVFELVDAIGRGDVGTALRLVHTHATDIRRILELIGLLGWHLRRLWMGRLRLDGGISLGVAARELGIPRHAQEHWEAQVRRWDQPALQQAARVLLQADAALKRGGSEPRVLLELIVIMLARLPDGELAATSSGPRHSGAAPLWSSPGQSAA